MARRRLATVTFLQHPLLNSPIAGPAVAGGGGHQVMPEETSCPDETGLPGNPAAVQLDGTIAVRATATCFNGVTDATCPRRRSNSIRRSK